MGIIFYISRQILKLIGLYRKLHLQENYFMVLYCTRCDSQAGLVLKNSEEQTLHLVNTDFISEYLCFCVAPQAKEAAASLVLCACPDMLGEKEQPCLEPQHPIAGGGPDSQARTKPAHRYKLAPLQRKITLAFFTNFRKIQQHYRSFNVFL